MATEREDLASKYFFPANGPNLCLIRVIENLKKVKYVDLNSYVKLCSSNVKLAFYFIANKEQ